MLYQPVEFSVGNVQLGTEEEFKAMCDAAHAEGLKIIVDVVSNHIGNNGGDGNVTIAPQVKFQGEGYEDYWHAPLHAVSSWDDRYEVTHGGIGLPDLNTANPNVQAMVRKFLEKCLVHGADGLRFDAAKHIELPSPLDDEKASSNYWPTVLGGLKTNDGTTPFVYGENLQGGADKFAEYTKLMDVTASNYGGTIRSIVGIGSTLTDLSDENFNNYESYNVPSGVDPSSLITWVESHDTYANTPDVSLAMTQEQIADGWALIASRAGSTPLYFNRTAGRTKLEGNLGDAGNDDWKNPDVVAVNKFHNAMEGKDETITKVSDKVVMIERGTEGIVIVNLGDAITGFNTTTNLVVGTYNNCATTGGTFTVADGKITGDLSKGITVLYTGGVTEPKLINPKVSINKENCSFTGTLDLALNVDNGVTTSYSIDGVDQGSFVDGQSIQIGGDDTLGKKITVNVSAISVDGTTVSETYNYIQRDPNAKATVYFTKPADWQSPNIYIYNELSEAYNKKSWPGSAMEKIGTNLYRYEIKGFTDCKVIFNYGSTQTADLPITANGMKIYDATANERWADTVEIPKDPNITPDDIEVGSTVYVKVPDGWVGIPNLHYWNTAGKATAWPGIAMTDEGNGLYSGVIPKSFGDVTLIFNDGSNKITDKGGNSEFNVVLGSSRIFENGEWKDYVKTPTTPGEPTPMPEEPSTPDTTPVENDGEKEVSKTPTIIGKIYSSTGTVNGTVGANAEIILSVDEITRTTTSAQVEIGSTKADKDGKWSVKIPTQSKGNIIKITAKEEGRLETSITVTVIKKSSSGSSSSSSNAVTVNGNTTTIKSTDATTIGKEISSSTTHNIKVDLASQPVVGKSIFESLASNPSKTLTLVGENASWIFNGADISTNGAMDIDTTIKSISQNSTLINNLVGGKEVVNLSFDYKGLLPGKAIIQANVNSKYNGKVMNAYSYNAANSRLTLVSANVAVKDGVATFEVTKGSDYILSETPVAGAVKEGWNQNTDGSWIFVKDENNTTGWINDGDNWYLTDQSGIMKTGWTKDSDGKWYYLNNSGVMQTSWINDNGTWYYLSQSGDMLYNTSVAGYTLGADGAWIA